VGRTVPLPCALRSRLSSTSGLLGGRSPHPGLRRLLVDRRRVNSLARQQLSSVASGAMQLCAALHSPASKPRTTPEHRQYGGASPVDSAPCGSCALPLGIVGLGWLVAVQPGDALGHPPISGPWPCACGRIYRARWGQVPMLPVIKGAAHTTPGRIGPLRQPRPWHQCFGVLALPTVDWLYGLLRRRADSIQAGCRCHAALPRPPEDPMAQRVVSLRRSSNLRHLPVAADARLPGANVFSSQSGNCLRGCLPVPPCCQRPERQGWHSPCSVSAF